MADTIIVNGMSEIMTQPENCLVMIKKTINKAKMTPKLI